MALKNLFDMVKADKYTADGREALIKAQEAETEDATRRTYQIGEISQATGLQKTANGWVKPKSGKLPGAKKEEPKNVHGAEVDKIYERQLKRIKELKAKGFTDEQIDNDKIIKQTKEDMKNVGKKPEAKKEAQEALKKQNAAAGMPGRDYPVLKKEDHVKLAKEVLSNTSATDPGWTAEEIAKEWKLGEADAEEVKKEFDNLRKGSSGNKPAESKPAAGSQPATETKSGPAPKTPKPSVQEYMKAKQRVKAYEEQYKKEMDDFEYMERLKANGVNTSIFNPMYGGKPKPLEENKSYMEELNKIKAFEATDAAPRILTGDTRIRVRKA